MHLLHLYQLNSPCFPFPVTDKDLFSLYSSEGEGVWRLRVVQVGFDVSILMTQVPHFCLHDCWALAKPLTSDFPQMHNKEKGLYLFMMNSVTCMRDVPM